MAAREDPLRAEVEAATVEEIKRVGPEAFNKAEIAKRFADRGVSRATLYRWIDVPLKTGEAGQAVAREVQAAVEQRLAEPDPPQATGRAAAKALPVVPTVQDVSQDGGAVAVIRHLNTCVGVAQQVIDYARNGDGSVRSVKWLVAASEHLRRTLETAARLQTSMNEAARVDQFHKDIVAVIEGVAHKHPAVAEEIVNALRQLSTQWGAE